MEVGQVRMRRALMTVVVPHLAPRITDALRKMDPVPRDHATAAVASEREVRDVLRAYDIEPTGLRRISGGSINLHWVVEGTGGPFVLREYGERRTSDAIWYEHAVLRHLDRPGRPVAPARESRDGSTVVAHHGRLYALFPKLPGRARSLAADLLGRGRLLADLHTDLSDFSLAPDWSRLGVFDRVARGGWVAADDRGLRQLVHKFEPHAPSLARDILMECDLVQAEIDCIGTADLLRTVIHHDYHGGNILYSEGRITGVLDFDFAHPDLAIVDIARSASFLRRRGLIARFVQGYHRRRTLDEREVRLIGPMIRVLALEHIGFVLAVRPGSSEDQVMWMINEALDTVRFERARSTRLESYLARGLE